jgi:hypothetical protein
MVRADAPGACDGRAGVDSVEETLEVREGGERIVLALAHPRSPVEPAPRRNIGDRVAVADDEIAPGQMIVQDLVVTLGLAAVAIHRIAEPFRRGVREMHRLP